VLIRAAVDADWPAIHPIFAAVVAEGRTYAYPDGLSSDEARALWMLKPPGRTVVAVDDGQGVILGTATMGPNRPGRGSHIATASFMVDPAARGRGVGRALGEHMLNWANEQGYRGVQFNAVVETNEAAVRLWQSLGFRIIGTVPGAFDHAEHGYVGLHVMFRRVHASGSPV
jgi:L-amino acid N-acyltransferase YncA